MQNYSVLLHNKSGKTSQNYFIKLVNKKDLKQSDKIDS